MRRRIRLFAALAAVLEGACAAESDASNAGVDVDASELRATPIQRRQAKDLSEVVAFLRDRTAWHGELDYRALERRGRAAIYAGDGSERAFFGALFKSFVAVPEGHQSLYLKEGCGTTLAMSGYATRGVCGRPHARGIVVTAARAQNPLGLRAGDMIVGVTGASGHGVLEALGERPMCVTSRPSTSFRDAEVSATFADLLEPAERVEVESPSGARRVVTVPAGGLTGFGPDALACQDPLGRASLPVEATMRTDGVAVIRLPGFTDPEQPFPMTGTQEDVDAYRQRFEAKIGAAFDSVKRARAIVWDIRGNGGGLTMVGLGIASGFPGARSEPLSTCQARIPGSTPAAFGEDLFATYALSPGGRFAYRGKVAVLTDGLDYSAADYFPLVARSRTAALLVGAATAGAFGATSETKEFAGPPAFSVSVDANRCVSLDDGLPLEGRSVEPHLAVDYEPKDLAAGRDTILERAAAALLGR